MTAPAKDRARHRSATARFDQAIRRQIDRNRGKNLLYAHVDQIIEIEPGFLSALEELLTGDEGGCSQYKLDEAVSLASTTLLERIYAINQFLHVGDGKREQLDQIYIETWTRILTTRNIKATLQEFHYPALSAWLAELYPDHFVDPLRSVATVRPVVCQEYSPELQLELLGVDVRVLQAPLIDVGCGSHARLVRYLRAVGIEAYGIDRCLEQREPYLAQADWLDYAFEPERWGTIISNMAFTNHVVYAYHHDRARLQLCLSKFSEIVASLRIGGSCHYAPSLPFVEERLGSQYTVQRILRVQNISVTRITRKEPPSI